MTEIATLAEIENAKPGEVVFLSRYANLTLTRVNSLEEVLVGGVRRQVTNGKRYRFEQGVLRVKPGKDRLVDHDGWLAADAEQDVERDIVEALRAHRLFNRDFHEVGKEPGRLVPYEEDFLGDLHSAVAELDVDAIEALIAAEKDGHNRPLLVKSAQKALETAVATRTKLEAEANDRDAENASQPAQDAAKKPAKAKAE